VVRHADRHGKARQVRRKSAERSPVGQQNREVVQTKGAATRHRARAPAFAQHDQCATVGGPDGGGPLAGRRQLQSQQVLVVLHRPAKVGNLQVDGANVGNHPINLSLSMFLIKA